jgi:hypothetical protein
MENDTYGIKSESWKKIIDPIISYKLNHKIMNYGRVVPSFLIRKKL